MGRTILVGVDGSEQSTEALVYALERFPDAEITAVSVVNPVDASAGTYPTESLFEAHRERAEGYLDDAADLAADRDREIDTEVLVGRPAREIVAYAEAADVDQVVVGSRGRTGLSRMLLGSVAESVVRRAPAPVTVVR